MGVPATVPQLLPQGSGANGNVPLSGFGGGAKAVAPIVPTPSPVGSVNPANNPYALPAGGGAPAVPIGQNSGINWNDGSYTVTGDFKDTYGAGTGTAITDVLKNLGTSTDAAIQATENQVNQEATNQFSNIRATEAASGITPNSSSASLAAGDFFSNVNLGLQSTIAGMENQQEDTLLSALIGEGKAHGGDTSTWDSISSALGSFLPAFGAGANALNETAMSGTGTFSEILSALGALA